MSTRVPAPPPESKCVCGHRYDEHVQGGDRHACQHGAEPPFTNLCACNRFRAKAEEHSSRKAGAGGSTGAAAEQHAPEPAPPESGDLSAPPQSDKTTEDNQT